MRLAPQALLSLLNTATSALALFFVFRLGFSHAGGEFMGLWALLSGLLMFARIADTGASVSVARLAVIGRTDGSFSLGPYLWAGLTVATLPTILLSSIIAIAVGVVLRSHWDGAGQAQILNQTIAVAWMYAVGNSLAGVLSGCLDGSGKMAWRYLGGTAANLVLIGLTVSLLPTLGAAGFLAAHVAFVGAQILIYILIMLSSRIELGLTRSAYVVTTRASFAFLSKSIFLGAARAGFEPVSKILIGYYGGLTSVALFDLAVRVSGQLRQLVNAPLQPIAVLTARSTAALSLEHQSSVERWMLISLAAGFVAALAQIVSSPVVSWLVLGRFEPVFGVMSAILALSFFVNFSGTVAYYVVLASGRLRALILIHGGMAMLNIGLGAAMGWLWGGMGVIAAWGITLAAGGPAALALYLRDHAFSGRRKKNLALAFAGGLVLLTAAAVGTAVFQQGIAAIIMELVRRMSS